MDADEERKNQPKHTNHDIPLGLLSSVFIYGSASFLSHSLRLAA